MQDVAVVDGHVTGLGVHGDDGTAVHPVGVLGPPARGVGAGQELEVAGLGRRRLQLDAHVELRAHDRVAAEAAVPVPRQVGQPFDDAGWLHHHAEAVEAVDRDADALARRGEEVGEAVVTGHHLGDRVGALVGVEQPTAHLVARPGTSPPGALVIGGGRRGQAGDLGPQDGDLVGAENGRHPGEAIDPQLFGQGCVVAHRLGLGQGRVETGPHRPQRRLPAGQPVEAPDDAPGGRRERQPEGRPPLVHEVAPHLRRQEDVGPGGVYPLDHLHPVGHDPIGDGVLAHLQSERGQVIGSMPDDLGVRLEQRRHVLGVEPPEVHRRERRPPYDAHAGVQVRAEASSRPAEEPPKWVPRTRVSLSPKRSTKARRLATA